MYVLCRETDKGTYYLVKWRDLPYDQATWEKEDADIADLQTAVDDYKNLRLNALRPFSLQLFTLF